MLRGARYATAPAVMRLAWIERGSRLRTADAHAGFYVVLSFDDVTWSAEWRPTNGRMKRLYFRGTVEEACAACSEHFLECQASVLLGMI